MRLTGKNMNYKSNTNVADKERERVHSLELPIWCKPLVFIEKSIKKILWLAVFGSLSVWLITTSYEKLSIPFAQLTPLSLIWGLVIGLIGLFTLVITLFGVFGYTVSQIELKWRESQLNQKRILGYDSE